MLAALGALVLIGGFVTFYRLVLSDKARHHELAVDWPVAAPRGEPIVLGHELKDGDVFLTTYESHTRILLAVDNSVALSEGMFSDITMLVGHGVKAATDGAPGLVSTHRTAIQAARSNPAFWTAPVWTALNNSAVPAIFTMRRDAQGVPVGPLTGGPSGSEQRIVLDGFLCGLGDLATTYLPPRPVRLGDVWDLADAVSLPGIAMVVRKVARTDEFAGGYPELKIVGKVAAETLEPRDGEPCLRLRLVVYVTQEGEAVAPALPGRISTAARITGPVWISTGKGTFWEEDLASEILTSYLCARPTERHATATLTAKTVRGTRMPGE